MKNLNPRRYKIIYFQIKQTRSTRIGFVKPKKFYLNHCELTNSRNFNSTDLLNQKPTLNLYYLKEIRRLYHFPKLSEFDFKLNSLGKLEYYSRKCLSLLSDFQFENRKNVSFSRRLPLLNYHLYKKNFLIIYPRRIK